MLRRNTLQKLYKLQNLDKLHTFYKNCTTSCTSFVPIPNKLEGPSCATCATCAYPLCLHTLCPDNVIGFEEAARLAHRLKRIAMTPNETKVVRWPMLQTFKNMINCPCDQCYLSKSMTKCPAALTRSEHGPKKQIGSKLLLDCTTFPHFFPNSPECSPKLFPHPCPIPCLQNTHPPAHLCHHRLDRCTKLSVDKQQTPC